MQVRAAITRGDVEAALAGIERIDPQVGLWVDEWVWTRPFQLVVCVSGQIDTYITVLL